MYPLVFSLQPNYFRWRLCTRSGVNKTTSYITPNDKREICFLLLTIKYKTLSSGLRIEISVPIHSCIVIQEFINPRVCFQYPRTIFASVPLLVRKKNVYVRRRRKKERSCADLEEVCRVEVHDDLPPLRVRLVPKPRENL